MSRLLPLALAILFLPAVAQARPLHRRAPTHLTTARRAPVRYPALDRMIRQFAADARQKQKLIAER